MADVKFPRPSQMDWEALVLVGDAVLAGAIVVVLILAAAKLTLVGGRSALAIGCGCLSFFSRLYQAALGLVCCAALFLALYFYLTTEDTRAVLHEQASNAVPLVSQVVANVHSGARQALQSEVVVKGAQHVKYIAEKVFSPHENQ